MNNQISELSLKEVIDRMKEVVENSKDEIFHINESALKEHKYLENELENVKLLVQQYINESDRLEEEVRKSKLRLLNVSKEFNRYNEEEIKKVYDLAYELQTKLVIVQQEERTLRQKRDDLERRLIRLSSTIERAENLGRKVGAILTYINQDFTQVDKALKSVSEKQQLGFKIFEIQESERKRLSREIHDGPAQMLANILIRSEFVDHTFKEGNIDVALKEMNSIRKNIRQSLQEVRRIIYDLRPMALDDLGLIPTVKKHISSMSEYANIPIHLKIIGKEAKIDSNYEIGIFRLLQESIQNAINHAKAKEIIVKVEFSPNQINIIVKDEGVGFNIEQVEEKSDSFGLAGMKERVDLLKGKLSIQSELNQGTTIIISIPINSDLLD